jgi:hypothetical protein
VPLASDVCMPAPQNIATIPCDLSMSHSAKIQQIKYRANFGKKNRPTPAEGCNVADGPGSPPRKGFAASGTAACEDGQKQSNPLHAAGKEVIPTGNGSKTQPRPNSMAGKGKLGVRPMRAGGTPSSHVGLGSTRPRAGPCHGFFSRVAVRPGSPSAGEGESRISPIPYACTSPGALPPRGLLIGGNN